MPAEQPPTNRHPASTIPLAALLGACVFAHLAALSWMETPGRQVASLPARTVRCMTLIDFINNHGWMALAYVATFLGCLVWLEIRAAPRWSVWTTFVILSLPCLAYLRACLYLGWQ